MSTRFPDLGTLADQGGASPKPSRLDRLARWVDSKREHQKQADAFRRAVWKRDQAICQVCRRKVIKTALLDPARGHVHHKVPRSRSRALKYETSNGILLCSVCHARVHQGEIHL
jgi:5-methylcytosine-specific restriction endonuclease McrA